MNGGGPSLRAKAEGGNPHPPPLRPCDRHRRLDRGLTVRAKRRQRCRISNWLAASRL
jgi:hypothetical protein